MVFSLAEPLERKTDAAALVGVEIRHEVFVENEGPACVAVQNGLGVVANPIARGVDATVVKNPGKQPRILVHDVTRQKQAVVQVQLDFGSCLVQSGVVRGAPDDERLGISMCVCGL